MQVPEYKPVIVEERQVQTKIDCSYADNGVSLWCESPDDLVKALSGENVPKNLNLGNQVLASGTSNAHTGFSIPMAIPGKV